MSSESSASRVRKDVFFFSMFDDSPSREISDPERNRHKKEVPMPEEKTGDVTPPPDQPPQEPPHMPGQHQSGANPAHPPSERE